MARRHTPEDSSEPGHALLDSEGTGHFYLLLATKVNCVPNQEQISHRVTVRDRDEDRFFLHPSSPSGWFTFPCWKNRSANRGLAGGNVWEKKFPR